MLREMLLLSTLALCVRSAGSGKAVPTAAALLAVTVGAQDTCEATGTCSDGSRPRRTAPTDASLPLFDLGELAGKLLPADASAMPPEVLSMISSLAEAQRQGQPSGLALGLGMAGATRGAALPTGAPASAAMQEEMQAMMAHTLQSMQDLQRANGVESNAQLLTTIQ